MSPECLLWQEHFYNLKQKLEETVSLASRHTECYFNSATVDWRRCLWTNDMGIQQKQNKFQENNITRD